MTDIHGDKILILDFGAQYTQLIARRVRELGVYCELHPWDMSDADLLPYESISAACTLSKPYLLIHSDNSFLPDAARRDRRPEPQAG